MSVYLIVVEDNNFFRVEISETACILGKSKDCQVVLKDSTLNEKHCSFMLVEGKAYLTDLHSSEGTIVNDLPLNDGFVFIGDRIRVGNVALFLDPIDMTPKEQASHTRPPRENTVELVIERPTPPILPEKTSWKEKLNLLLDRHLEEFEKEVSPSPKAQILLREIKDQIKRELWEELEERDPTPERKEQIILEFTTTNTQLGLEEKEKRTKR